MMLGQNKIECLSRIIFKSGIITRLESKKAPGHNMRLSKKNTRTYTLAHWSGASETKKEVIKN